MPKIIKGWLKWFVASVVAHLVAVALLVGAYWLATELGLHPVIAALMAFVAAWVMFIVGFRRWSVPGLFEDTQERH